MSPIRLLDIAFCERERRADNPPLCVSRIVHFYEARIIDAKSEIAAGASLPESFQIRWPV